MANYYKIYLEDKATGEREAVVIKEAGRRGKANMAWVDTVAHTLAVAYKMFTLEWMLVMAYVESRMKKKTGFRLIVE